MKLLIFLTLNSIAISNSRSTNEEHLERAAEQLNRLAIFRRTQQDGSKATAEKWSPISSLLLNKNDMELSNQSREKILINTDMMKKIDELATITYNIAKDPNYNSKELDRIKRSGSGDFISGIAGHVINSVVGASGGLSHGSSGGSSAPEAHDSYGVPVHPYEEHSLSIWDIKKAIINTLIQALKALAGGAIAVKGQLIKGGGFIVQTTGRVISSAGEVASSLGTHIASSAVISQHKPSSPGYSYNPPSSQDYTYESPPPNSDPTYSQHSVHHHHHFGTPSDATPANEPGLLIIKPMNNNEAHHHYHQQDNDAKYQDDTAAKPQPSLSTLEESFSAIPKKNTGKITKLVGLITGTSKIPQTNQHDSHVEYAPAEHKDQPLSSPPSLYNPDSHHAQHHPLPSTLDYNNGQQHDQKQNQLDHNLQFSQGNSHEIPTNQDHQWAYQQIQSLLNPHLQLPLNDAQNFFIQPSNQGLDLASESMKISMLNHMNIHPNALEIGGFSSYGLPTGYGVPMAAIYPSLKRVGFIPLNMKKIKSKNMLMKRGANYRTIRNSMLHMT